MSARVLIADDHLPMRTLVEMILRDNGFEIVGHAATGRQAAELAEELRPDVCVLDLHMPEGGGLHAVQAITDALPHVKCVMLTSSDSDADMLEALRAGAVGYLTKDIDLDCLPAALRGVLRGEAAVPRARMTRVIEELRVIDPPGRPGQHVVELTDREWQVVKAMREAMVPNGR